MCVSTRDLLPEYSVAVYSSCVRAHRFLVRAGGGCVYRQAGGGKYRGFTNSRRPSRGLCLLCYYELAGDRLKGHLLMFNGLEPPRVILACVCFGCDINRPTDRYKRKYAGAAGKI